MLIIGNQVDKYDMSKSLYTDIVDITTKYLGPTAERFIARHIEVHLHIQPSEITSEKIPALLKWLRASMTLITSDTKIVNDFSNRIEGLQK